MKYSKKILFFVLFELSAAAILLPANTATALTEPTVNCANDPRVAAGLVSLEVCRGANIFFRGGFDGNGRTCGSCHRVEDSYTISTEFIGALPPEDGLFAPEQQPAIEDLELMFFLRSFGLITENVDGLDDIENKFVQRSVPHILSLSTSINSGRTEPPLDALGWSGDGAPNDGTLRDFLTGAVIQHYPLDLSRVEGVSFTLPNNAQLNRVEAFQMALGRTNELDLNNVTIIDNSASNGRNLFMNNRCNGCHNNAGANTSSGINMNFNTGVALLTPVPGLIPDDGGFGTEPNGFGSFGDGTFNVPPLIEAADTGPFFHNNIARTIEEAIDFFNSPEFNGSPAGLAGDPISLTVAQVVDIGRFLRVLNASFNLAIAIQRLEAAQTLMNLNGTSEIPVQNELIQLAVYELEDAGQVLSRAKGGRLAPVAIRRINMAILRAASAMEHTGSNARLNAVGTAIFRATKAKARLGSGMNFSLGSGNLMR
jgi:hypothetical protein